MPKERWPERTEGCRCWVCAAVTVFIAPSELTELSVPIFTGVSRAEAVKTTKCEIRIAALTRVIQRQGRAAHHPRGIQPIPPLRAARGLTPCSPLSPPQPLFLPCQVPLRAVPGGIWRCLLFSCPAFSRCLATG